MEPASLGQEQSGTILYLPKVLLLYDLTARICLSRTTAALYLTESSKFPSEVIH